MPNLYTTLQDFIGKLEETQQPQQYISPLEAMMSAQEPTSVSGASGEALEPTPQSLPLPPAVTPKTTQPSLSSFIPAGVNEKVKKVITNYITRAVPQTQQTALSPQTFKRLSTQVIDPLKNTVFTNFLTKLNQLVYPYKVRVIEGFRSPQRQAQLYQQGRTTRGGVVTYARAGQSAHQTGMAVDIGFVSPSGKSILPSQANAMRLYDIAGQAARNSGLIWGGTFKGLVDKPHFEIAGR